MPRLNLRYTIPRTHNGRLVLTYAIPNALSDPSHTFQMRGYPRGRLRATQAAERDQPKAEGLGGTAGVETLRGFCQLPGEKTEIVAISSASYVPVHANAAKVGWKGPRGLLNRRAVECLNTTPILRV